MGVLYAVLAALLILASVALHEAGHLITAKRYGMKATQYFVGFGPKIWSFQRGETEYGLKAIPAGGYVKIVGMSPLEAQPGDAAPDPEAVAREVAALPTDTVPDERRLFYTYPARQRAIVLSAGSFTHFVLAVLMTFAAIALGGDLFSYHERSVVSSVIAGSPAQAAGLQAGDRIEAVDGVPVDRTQKLIDDVRGSAGRPVVLSILRAGHVLSVTATPHSVGSAKPTIGVALDSEDSAIRYSVGGAALHTVPTLGTFIKDTGVALGHLPAELSTIVQGKTRSSNESASSVVGVVRASADVGGAKDVSQQNKIAFLFAIGGELNLFVGIFNLLPLLPLDGGHVAILGFEKLRAWFARRRGRRDPGRVNLLKVLPVAYTVVVLFIGLSVLLVYADIVNPIKGT